MPKKKKDPDFIDSVPDMVEEVRAFKDQTLSNPAIPFPWPSYVPTPEVLDREVGYLWKVYEAIGDPKIRTGGELGRSRKRVKTRFSQLARYVVLTMEGSNDLREWPGFDLSRNLGENRQDQSERSAARSGRRGKRRGEI